MKKWLLYGIGAVLLSATAATAGEKDFLHCFYFTPLAEAGGADWKAFFDATDSLQGKVSGLKHVWYGKLNRPMESDPPRQWGVCMAFGKQDDFRSYAGSVVHAAWEKSYFKVRQPGTTTTDLTGQ
jgi:hypothetical protein